MTDLTSQIVYVLTNPAMPGLVKIEMTTQSEVGPYQEEAERSANCFH